MPDDGKPARIRWEKHETGSAVMAYTGYVGAAGLGVFAIFEPEVANDDHVLTAALPGMGNKRSYGTPDELKAEAERWLTEFAGSLGALFPELRTVSYDLSDSARRRALIAALGGWGRFRQEPDVVRSREGNAAAGRRGGNPMTATEPDNPQDGGTGRFRDYGRERLQAALDAVIADGSDLEVLGDIELALMALSMYYGSSGPITLNPADVVEIIDTPEPKCICPPGLVERGGYRGGCPVHATIIFIGPTS